MSDIPIFVSYAREDIAAARRVYSALQRAGHKPWIDEIDLLPGQKWKDAIQEAIQKSRFFIALLSSRSFSRKGYVHTELARALDELDSFPDSQIYLIPARLDSCEVPRQRLRELHWVDLFDDWDSGIARILHAIETNVGRRGSIAHAPREILECIMDTLDSPPYGDRTHQHADRIPIVFAVKGVLPDIADALNEAPVESMPNDPNEDKWAVIPGPTQYESIDGFWESRWRCANGAWCNGTALFRTIGGWVTIEVQDKTNQYAIRARKDGQSRLVGRYMNCSMNYDTTPWVGLIVDNSRIDGFWHRMEDRWDFRR